MDFEETVLKIRIFRPESSGEDDFSLPDSLDNYFIFLTENPEDFEVLVKKKLVNE